MNVSVRETAAQALEKSKPALDRITTIAHDAIDKAAALPAQAKDWRGGKGEQLSARQKKLIGDASTYVSANPMKAIGMAVVTVSFSFEVTPISPVHTFSP